MPSIARRPVRDGAERERLEARTVLTACAHCSDSFEGTLAAGRSWFAEHRTGAHPELPPVHLRRRTGFRLSGSP